jgi:Holliday junction resolvase RusA-like endonuclease
MTELLNIFIPGLPKAQPRPRAFARNMGGGKFAARVYDAGTAEGWKSCIAAALADKRPSVPHEGALRLDARFLMPRPKCLMRKNDPAGLIPHTSKPDRDNLDKAVMDTLTQIGFVRDDCIVCSGLIEKFYHGKTGVAGVHLVLKKLDAVDIDEVGLVAMEI